MYKSTYTSTDIYDMLCEEVDISTAISAPRCARWISSLEQLLYADVIKDYRTATVNLLDGDTFDLDEISPDNNSRAVAFDDIAKVYDEDEELVKCSPIAAHQFKGEKAIYWREGDSCYAKLLRSGVEKLTVIYKAMPALKVNDEGDATKALVCIPDEWIELVLSKVRGEAYKLAGDDAQAAKWLNDYNAQLESFKVWIAERQKWFGE